MVKRKIERGENSEPTWWAYVVHYATTVGLFMGMILVGGFLIGGIIYLKDHGVLTSASTEMIGYGLITIGVCVMLAYIDDKIETRCVVCIKRNAAQDVQIREFGSPYL